MKKKIFKFFLWSLATIIALVALCYAWIDWHGTRTWKKTEAALIAKGEPLLIREIIPPSIPDQKNFAYSPFFKGVFETETVIENGREVYRPKYPEAIERLQSLAFPIKPASTSLPSMKDDVPIDLVSWQAYFRAHPEFKIPDLPAPPAEDVLLALKNWRVPLDEIAQDLRVRPLMRAPLNYERGYALALPHFTGLLQVSKLFKLRAIAYIRLGNAASGFSDLQSILLLRNTAEPKQSLVGSLIAGTITSQAKTVLREGIARQIWDEAQLAELAATFKKIKPMPEMANAFRIERVMFLETTRDMSLKKLLSMTQVFGSHDASSSPWWENIPIPHGFWEYNRDLYARLIQFHLEKVVDPKHGRIHVTESQKWDAQLQKHKVLPKSLLYLHTTLTMPVLGKLGFKSAEFAALTSQAEVAIALERYWLAHGSLPDDPSALVPDFLAQIPIDPIDGKPLHYLKVSDTNYRIWSIGWDQKDGGGVAGKTRSEGDCVWTSLPTNR